MIGDYNDGLDREGPFYLADLPDSASRWRAVASVLAGEILRIAATGACPFCRQSAIRHATACPVTIAVEHLGLDRNRPCVTCGGDGGVSVTRRGRIIAICPECLGSGQSRRSE